MRKSEFVMNIESAKLRTYFAFPNIEWVETIGEVNGNEYIELRYENESNPRFPIILTFNRYKGIFLEMGRRNYFASKIDIFDDYLEELINLVLNDKVITRAFYTSEKKFKKQKSWSSRFWYETGDSRGNMDGYNDYLMFVTRPPHPYEKFSPFSSSIVEISDWSGKRYNKIFRKRGNVIVR